jgi:DNA processing protein
MNMENSFLSLLYAHFFGLRFKESELQQISSHKHLPVEEILSLLSPETRGELHRLNWRERWQRALEVSHRLSVGFASRFCEDYPASFHHLPEPPLLVTYMGKPIWQKQALVGVVGSRRPCPQTLEWMSHHLPGFLQAAQMTVVSGGARGVDQWAHRLSLAAGRSTLCVVPSGLSCLYPEGLKEFSAEVTASGGAFLSAYALDQEMRKYFFPQRNQWIAALGSFCFVAEAGLKSGSLLTAKLAQNLGREVMTLPFSVWQGGGAGSNWLLQQGGAHLALREEDLIALAFREASKFRCF